MPRLWSWYLCLLLQPDQWNIMKGPIIWRCIILEGLSRCLMPSWCGLMILILMASNLYFIIIENIAQKSFYEETA